MGSNLIRRLAAPDSWVSNSHFPQCWVSRMLQNPVATHHVRTSKWNSRIEAKTFPKTRQVTTSLDLPLLAFIIHDTCSGKRKFLQQHRHSSSGAILLLSHTHNHQQQFSIPILHLSKSKWPEEKASPQAGRQEARRQQARHQNRTAQRLAYRYVTTVRVDVLLAYISSAESAQVIPRVSDRNWTCILIWTIIAPYSLDSLWDLLRK